MNHRQHSLPYGTYALPRLLSVDRAVGCLAAGLGAAPSPTI